MINQKDGPTMPLSFNINYDQKKVDNNVNAMMLNGMTKLGNDIKKRAILLEPKLTGNLRRNTKSYPTKTNVTIIANTDYARRRHYENKKHPSTRYYLANALKSINDIGKYFK